MITHRHTRVHKYIISYSCRGRMFRCVCMCVCVSEGLLYVCLCVCVFPCVCRPQSRDDCGRIQSLKTSRTMHVDDRCGKDTIRRPAITPANQAGTWFTYTGRWKAELTLVAARPGIGPTIAWSQIRRPNRRATKTPYTYNVLKDLYIVVKCASELSTVLLISGALLIQL